MVGNFESPRFLVEQTRSAALKFTELVDDFMRRTPPAFAIETLHLSQEKQLVLKFEPFPATWRSAASHGIGDLRLALDQATDVACKKVGGTQQKFSRYFPIGGDPSDLDGKIRKDIPLPLVPTFQSFQCYPSSQKYTGGNNKIVELNKASRLKHVITCGAGASVEKFSFRRIVLRDGTRFPIFSWNPALNALVIARWPINNLTPDIPLDVHWFIAFQNAGPIDGLSIPDTLTDAAQEVSRIIDLIEAAVY